MEKLYCTEPQHGQIYCLQKHATFHTTGNVTKKDYPKENAFQKLTPPTQPFILQLTMEKECVHIFAQDPKITMGLASDVSTIYWLYMKEVLLIFDVSVLHPLKCWMRRELIEFTEKVTACEASQL